MKKPSPLKLLVASLGLVADTGVHAQTDQDWFTGGPSNDWNTSQQNWDSGTATWTNNNNSIFGGSPETVTVTEANIRVNDITFDTGYTIADGVGTLQLGDDAASTITVASGATATITETISNGVGGGSSLTKEGAGTLALSANNAYTGGTIFSEGLVTFDNAASFGTGILTLNGGNLYKSTTSSLGLNAALDITGESRVGSTTGNLTFFGTILDSGGTFYVSNNAADFDGNAPGDMVLTVRGEPSIFIGTFRHNNIGNTGNLLRFGAPSAGGVGYNLSSARIFLEGSTTGENGVELSDGTSGTFQIGELAGTGGRLRAGFHDAGNTTIEVGALDTDSQFAGNLDDNVNGSFGLAALTKVGMGSLELTLATGNNYSAGTTVSDGNLLVSNSSGSGTGSGAVTVSASGMLGGTGRIAPAGVDGISVSGILAPGGSVSATTGGTFNSDIGTLAVDLGGTTGTFSMLVGSEFTFELGSANGSISVIAAGSSDQLTLTGASSGDFTFNANPVNFLGTGEVGFYKLFDTSLDSTTWSGLTFDGTTGVVSSGLSVTNLPGGLTASFIVGGFSSGGDSGDIYLQVVPEPGTVAMVLGGIGMLALICRRRGRN